MEKAHFEGGGTFKSDLIRDKLSGSPVNWDLPIRANLLNTTGSTHKAKNDESQYLTWHNVFNELSEKRLREVVRAFEAKIEDMKARFKFLKANNYAMDNLFRRNNVELESAVHPQLLDNYEFDYLDTNLRDMQMIMALINNSSDCF
ncbi:hypothetical protein LguiB_021585 [Lonicera macranthoides]